MNMEKQSDNMENTNKNYWSIIGNGLLFASPWIAMLVGTIVHYWSTNEGVVDLGFTLILITWCAGVTNARCEHLEKKIAELENKLNKNENKD